MTTGTPPPSASAGTRPPSTRIEIRFLTAGDVPRVAEIHMAACPRGAMARMGMDVLEKFYEWQITGPHPDSISLGAVEDGRLVGVLISGKFSGSTGGFVRKNRAMLIRRLMARPWLLGNELVRERVALGLRILTRRLKPTPTFDPPFSYHNGSAFISLLVHPDHRGMSALLMIRRAEEIAAQHGYGQIHHCVDPKNTPVVKMYDLLKYEKINEDGQWKGLYRKTLVPAGGEAKSNP